MGGGPCFWIAVCVDLCVVQCLGAGLFLIGVLLVGMGLVSGGWSRLWIDVGGGPLGLSGGCLGFGLDGCLCSLINMRV